MMKINVYSEKSGNFGANSEKKPMIIIESKKRPLEPGQKDKNGKPILSLKEKYPDAMIIDVTSKAQDEFVKFSPFLTSSLVRYFYLPHDGTCDFKGVSEDLTGDSG